MSDRNAPASRYQSVSDRKAAGVTYTPRVLADFVARHMVEAAAPDAVPASRPLRILDPAAGDGALLLSLLQALAGPPPGGMEVYGFETDADAMEMARSRIVGRFPDIAVRLRRESFLDFASRIGSPDDRTPQAIDAAPSRFDLVIANPPYVRVQIMGSKRARRLAARFGLTGRSDLCHAFVLAVSRVLAPRGTAGIIVSNRFMSTRAGACVRRGIVRGFRIRRVWDLGDTKLFPAAVLPAVLILSGRDAAAGEPPDFTAAYRTSAPARKSAVDPIAALDADGVVRLECGGRVRVRHGRLDNDGADDGVWRIATRESDAWLATVESHRWGTFGDIGRLRVGVKTCADRIFIRDDWAAMDATDRPELLRPVTTHHRAGRYRPSDPERPLAILYPHETVNGRRRAVDLNGYPRSRAYLESHRSKLGNRRYLIDAGRRWYEIWVPQDPDAWRLPKLVFRDIARRPAFWMDIEGTVVNGDCYWLACTDPGRSDLLWLAAAVGNSTLIERFYDHRFPNKLYGGRRRFLTQYVERFPLPDPSSPLAREAVDKARRIHRCAPSAEAAQLEREVDAVIGKAFGVDPA